MSVMVRKRGGGKSRRKGYRYLPVDQTFPIGNLTTKDVIADDLNSSVDQDTFMVSADLVWGTEDFTIGEGPLVVGLAHSDYTSAEIEECLEALASWDKGDKVANEQRKRKVRVVGAFPLIAVDEVLNLGMPVKTKLGFVVEIGNTLKTFAYNPTLGTIATGGSVTATGGINSRRM